MTRTLEDLKLWAEGTHNWITRNEEAGLKEIEGRTSGGARIAIAYRVNVMKRNMNQDQGFLMGLDWAGLFSWDVLDPIWDDITEHYELAINNLEGLAYEK